MKLKRAFSLVGLIVALQATPAVASEQLPFEASFHGTFDITFGGCANGDNLLRFVGPGLVMHAGLGSIDGVSCLRPEPANPLCSTIDDTTVTVTAANGDTFGFANQAEDCLSFTPDGIFIHGAGTYEILPGTGRFDEASGSGSVHTTAHVLALSATGASGTFDPLVFTGTISEGH
jgi:hypothetical protein